MAWDLATVLAQDFAENNATEELCAHMCCPPCLEPAAQEALPAETDNGSAAGPEMEESEVRDGEAWAGHALHVRMLNLKRQVGDQVYKYVKKIHHGLGHPSSETLVRTLQNARARDIVVTCARQFECPDCAGRRPPPAPAPSGPPPARHFLERVQMDVFWVKPNPSSNQRFPILHIVDTATRFGTARV